MSELPQCLLQCCYKRPVAGLTCRGCLSACSTAFCVTSLKVMRCSVKPGRGSTPRLCSAAHTDVTCYICMLHLQVTCCMLRTIPLPCSTKKACCIANNTFAYSDVMSDWRTACNTSHNVLKPWILFVIMPNDRFFLSVLSLTATTAAAALLTALNYNTYSSPQGAQGWCK